jgi:ABC-type transporter Mla maintaining outer membrane lipid asymmetry ATPase subunit MlaF
MVSNRVAMLSQGRIVAELPSGEFRTSSEKAIRDFIAAMPVGQDRPEMQGLSVGAGSPA